MSRKEMPLVLMLAAGAVTAIFSYFKGFNLSHMLVALLATLVIFYLIGSIIRYILDCFEKKNQKDAAPEGEVIEKEPEEGAEAKPEGKAENP